MDKDVLDALKNYHKYRSIIKELEDQILVIKTNQIKTGGSVIRMPEKNQTPKNNQIDYIMAKDKIQKKIDAYKCILEIVDDFIKSVSPSSRCMVYDRFIKQMSFSDLSKKYNYSERHIYRKINRLIEKYRDKNN